MSFAGCNEDDVDIARDASQKWCMQGDPYQEPDVVVRGVAMSELADAMGMDALPLKASDRVVEGDIYGEREDPMRGVSLSCADFISFSQDDYLLKPEPISLRNSEPRFSEAFHKPFEMEEGLVPQQSTTVVIPSQSPHAIGNSLLDFLHTRVEASIEKVHPKNIGIQAEVYDALAPALDYTACSVRMRVYKHKQAGRWQCEFSRQRGDSFGFSRVFLKAREWLQTAFPNIDEPWLSGPPPAPLKAVSVPSAGLCPDPEEVSAPSPDTCPEAILPDMDDLLDVPDMNDFEEAGLAPLYDMAAAGCPERQAEVAGAMAAIAEDRVNLLCTDRAFKEISELLKSNRTDIAYLTIRSLLALAACDEAKEYFVKDGSLLKAMLCVFGKEKQGGERWKLVQQLTAEAFALAVKNFAQSLGRKTSDEIVRDVEAMLKDITLVPEGDARRDLEKAKRVLTN
mmetsp:Transcript_44029/g.80461  ORF Transcript_44029/g.80461 Transcript_44029/m.80461 type:complete len:453 (+) Transcript_44029:118-1476(+)